EQTSRGPAAVAELPGEHLGQRLIALVLRGDSTNANRTPGEHGAVVQRFWRIVLQVGADLVEAGASLRRFGVAAGSDAHGQSRQGNAIMIVDLQRCVVTVRPFPAPILAL